jgi:hypothetical protein
LSAIFEPICVERMLDGWEKWYSRTLQGLYLLISYVFLIGDLHLSSIRYYQCCLI